MRRTGFEPLLVCGNKLLKLARRRQRFRKLDAQSSYGGEAVAPVWPAACGSDGNRFPAPPKCLHGLGSFRGNGEEPRGIAEDVESALHQQFDQKSAASRRIFQPPLIKCNSRRLHHSTRPLSGPRSWQATRAQASARCPDRGPRGPSRVVSRPSPKGESRGTIDESRREFTQCRRSLAPPSSFDPASPTS